MPIASSDIKCRLTVTTGTAGLTSASSGPASLGKYTSTTDMPSGLNLLFQQFSGTENAGLAVRYRAVDIYNTHPTLTAMGVRVYFKGGDPAGGSAWAIAVDPTAASAASSATPQGLTATSESAPGGSITGLSYTTPTTAASGVLLDNIAPGQVRRVWIRRTAQNNAAADETLTLTANYDTNA